MITEQKVVVECQVCGWEGTEQGLTEYLGSVGCCPSCGSDNFLDVEILCLRTIINKSWHGRTKRKCNRKATHKQGDGLPLCERHFNKWERKVASR